MPMYDEGLPKRLLGLLVETLTPASARNQVTVPVEPAVDAGPAATIDLTEVSPRTAKYRPMHPIGWELRAGPLWVDPESDRWAEEDEYR